jgi:hypothetical protein
MSLSYIASAVLVALQNWPPKQEEVEEVQEEV